MQVTTTSAQRDPKKGKVLRDDDGNTLAKPFLGLQGEVIKVLRKEERIIVKGVNMRTRVKTVRAHTYIRTYEHRFARNKYSLRSPVKQKIKRRKEFIFLVLIFCLF